MSENNLKINKKRKVGTASMAALGITLVITGTFAFMQDTLTHDESVTVEWIDIVDGSDDDLALEVVGDATNTPVDELTPGITYELTGTLENDSTVVTNWFATDVTNTPGMSVNIADYDGNDTPANPGEVIDVAQFGITITVDKNVSPSTPLNFAIEFASSDTRMSFLSTPAPINEVFVDPVLATCIANDDELMAITGGDVNYVITQDDLYNVTTLSCPDQGITSIEGIQYLANLTFLELYYNEISDITPLMHLTKLTYLDLDSNPINDFTPLASLTNLETLYINGTGFSDLTPLAGLTNLTTLSLADNGITDISVLANLTNLETLYLPVNNISDLSPLAELENLVKIDLNHNNLTDISPLANLDNLVYLDLEHNQITDFSPLAYKPGVFGAYQDPIVLPDTTLGTPTAITLKGINGAELHIEWLTPGTYENGQLTWENPGANGLIYSSTDGTIYGTISQNVN